MRIFLAALTAAAVLPGLALAQTDETELSADQIAAVTEACGGPFKSATLLATGQIQVICQSRTGGRLSEAQLAALGGFGIVAILAASGGSSDGVGAIGTVGTVGTR